MAPFTKAANKAIPPRTIMAVSRAGIFGFSRLPASGRLARGIIAQWVTVSEGAHADLRLTPDAVVLNDVVLANGVRLLASAVGALIAIYWFGLGAIGFFVAVAIGFCAFAAMAVSIMFRVKEPAATPS
jgi:hypothetical protein